MSKASGKGGKKERRLLTVEIVEAKGIIACSKAGSDPYVTCALLDLGGREIKAESFKTKAQSKTVNPKWNEKFTYGEHYDLDAHEDLPSLSLEIFHKGAFSVSEQPLGKVVIDIATLDETTDMAYPLETSGRMKNVSGELSLRLSFNRPPTTHDVEEGEQEDEEEGDKFDEEMDPNELNVTIVRARNLQIADKKLFGGGSSDPQVRIKLEGFDSKKSKYIRKSLNPVFNEKFVWEKVVDPSLAMKVIVEDHNDLKPTADFLGKVAIPLNEFDNKKPLKKWYRLRNKQMEADGIERGEIELLIHWKFNYKVLEDMRKEKEKYEASFLGKMNKIGGKMGRLVGALDEEESEAESEDDEQAEEIDRPKTEEEKEEEAKEAQEKLEELSDIQIVSGDYQVQVHIIECRELKAENLDGTSDPIVYVECFGQKQNTIVINQVTSCVYDELFIFNMRNLDKEQFEEGLIRINCYDSSVVPFVGNTMIGAYAIDATMVYTMNKDHELYRRWVPLMDDEDPDDVGVQGYMKISIQIIGPGEKIKVHDEDAERAEEIKKEAAAGGDISSLVLTTPTIRKEWKFVVASIYKCEGLPVMDGKVGMGVATVKKAGTDAFCRLSFAGGKPQKTKTVTVNGTSRLMINPEFNAELWYPVSVPTMTQGIKFSVWDRDPTESELIGNIMEKYNIISRTPRLSLDLKWYNMYGAHEFKQEKLLSNIKKGAVAVGKKARQKLGVDIDWKEFYNNVPHEAPSFKGRALMKFRIESKRPERHDKPEVKPFRRKVKALKRAQEPEVTDYVMQVLIVLGNELPSFGTITSQQLRVKVTMGVYELCSKPAKYENGSCRWNELLVTEAMSFPTDLNQIPDIFIYLVREDLKPVCYKRVKAVLDARNGVLLGFDTPAEWYLLQEDKAIDALNTDVFPGNVLLKIGFGPKDEAIASLDDWKNCLESSKRGSPYQARVHVYQGRQLPAADANGLCDPYVKINFMGKEEKTETIKKNVFPAYYKSFVFDNVMLPEFKNFTYASQVAFRLYDYDLDGSDYLGTCMYNLGDAVVTDNPDEELPLPKWLSFFREVPGDGQGELLVLVQLIPTLGASITSKPKSIIPETRKAFIEFIVIGMRDMAPYNFQAMQAPFLEIELNSFGASYLSTTASSKRPDPSNPNFLQKIMMPVMLPEISIFSSPLQIRAKDTRLGGYLKPIVGVCQIDLTTKIPWCPDTYQAPQTDIFYVTNDDPGNFKSGKLGGSGMLPGENDDRIARELVALQNERDGDIVEDDFIAQPEPISVEEYLKGRVAVEDTGAGVFGALNHIDLSGNAKKKKTGEDAFTDPDWTQDDGDAPPDWSINRKKLDAELEMDFQTTPFETYSLMRGKANGLFGSTLKTVGRLKGLVRIIEDDQEPPLLSEELMKQLLSPQKYVVRLYMLTGKALASMDYDMMGRPAKSDPYLKVRLGKDKFNDRQNAVDDVNEVDFYKMVEFNAELPGTSQLVIEVMDKDLIGSDDLIGKTTVDLEDRWFDKRWQDWGDENKMLPGDDPNDPTKVRWQTKPVERRSIYVPSKSLAQGVVECWVDIMRPEVAGTFPPDDVSLPPTQIFEVRVVIWKAKNVPPQDWLEGMSDLFVKCWPEGCKPAETDTHWRAKRGKASWNYRLLFDVELGLRTRAMKFPYLHLQLWDRDIVKWNDCAGEGTIDLGRYYRKAYKRNVALKLFETKKGAAARRAEKQEKKLRIDVQDTTEDIPPDEFMTEEEEAAAVAAEQAAAAGEGGGEIGEAAATGEPLVDENGDVVSPLAAAAATTTTTGADGEERKRDSDDDDDFPPATAATTDGAAVGGGGAAAAGAGGTGADGGEGAAQSSTYAPMNQLLPARNEIDSDDDSDVGLIGDAGDDMGLGAIPRDNNRLQILPPHKEKLRRPKPKKESKKKKKSKKKKPHVVTRWDKVKAWVFVWRWWQKYESPEPELDADGNPINPEDEEEDEGEDGADVENPKKENEDDDNKELKALINTFKSMTGLWDMDPEDSSWYHLEAKDKNDPMKIIPMGSICYSVQIWPKEMAVVMAAGAARSEPNTNPFLPPPVGRLRFSWNPFVLGSELCGPALCSAFFCCLIVAAFIVLMIFCQPFLNIIINLVFLVY